jgi:hypothetical protein
VTVTGDSVYVVVMYNQLVGAYSTKERAYNELVQFLTELDTESEANRRDAQRHSEIVELDLDSPLCDGKGAVA